MNENRDFQRNCSSIFKYDYNKESTQNVWVDKGTEFAEEIMKVCSGEGVHFYSTKSDTKAAITERYKTILETYSLPFNGQ